MALLLEEQGDAGTKTASCLECFDEAEDDAKALAPWELKAWVNGTATAETVLV